MPGNFRRKYRMQVSRSIPITRESSNEIHAPFLAVPAKAVGIITIDEPIMPARNSVAN
jgi:hypothetical protein